MPSDLKAHAVSALERAFADVRLGSGISLSQATAIDNMATADEQVRARLLDTELRWQDIPRSKLIDNYTALTFMRRDPLAMRFHLPAFLRLQLVDSSALPEFGLASLLREVRTDDDPAIAALTHAERTAIAQFLFAISPEAESDRRHWARRALAGYWARFLDRSPGV